LLLYGSSFLGDEFHFDNLWVGFESNDGHLTEVSAFLLGKIGYNLLDHDW